MKKLVISVGIIAAGFSFAACASTDGNKDKPNENPPIVDQTGNGTTVTFSAGDGAFADGKKSIGLSVDANGKVSLSDAPRYDGHAFAGWYNGNVEYDPNAVFGTDCTFTARYISGNTAAVYEALFDEQSTVSIDINMSDAEWKKLNADYVVFNNKGSKSPIYRMADSVTIGIDDGDGMLYYYYEEVGVRMKGNTSRHEFYGDNGFYNNIHMKLSFKQTFDDISNGYTESELKHWEDSSARAERASRMFGGMEKIDIKYNSTSDETYVREMYAMKMFRDNGVVAPHVTMCSVTALEKDSTVKNLGVYRIHEAIDEQFILRNFDDADVGDLWKCTYTVTGPADLTDYDLDNRIGVEDELNGKFYSYDKKTNKKKDKVTGLRDFSSMRNFIKAINESNADMSQYLDVEQFAKFEAVNYLLGNPDCIRNNYNNYYVYFGKSDNKAVIIPYDYDRCLGLTKDWNPTGSASMYLTPYTRTIAATNDGQNNPLYKKLIDKGADTSEGSTLMCYRSYLIELAESQSVALETFNAYKNMFKTRYGKYTNGAIGANSLMFDATNTGNVPYSEYMNTKLETLKSNIDNYYA